MDIKEYLGQIKRADTMIDSKIKELENLRSMRTRVTSTLSADVVSRTRSTDPLGDATARILDLEREINEQIDKFVDLKREVLALLEKVKHEKQYRVLHARYILYHTWEHIADEMGYSYYGVCKLHGRALQTVEKIMKVENNANE